jgi:putative Mn2+ efflux pump MntP
MVTLDRAVVGLLLGHSLSRELGSAAKPLGGTLLGLVGCYMVISELVRSAASTSQ